MNASGNYKTPITIDGLLGIEGEYKKIMTPEERQRDFEALKKRMGA
jgi:hypothetical protein